MNRFPQPRCCKNLPTLQGLPASLRLVEMQRVGLEAAAPRRRSPTPLHSTVHVLTCTGHHVSSGLPTEVGGEDFQQTFGCTSLLEACAQTPQRDQLRTFLDTLELNSSF